MPRIAWDFDYKLVYVNDAFADLLGYTKEEMIGQPFPKFLHPESTEKTLEYYETNTGTGVSKFKDYYNRYQHKVTGDVVWIHWLIGFNDDVLQLGSCECAIVNEKDVPKEFL